MYGRYIFEKCAPFFKPVDKLPCHAKEAGEGDCIFNEEKFESVNKENVII